MNFADVLGEEPGEIAQAQTQEEAREVVARAATEGKTIVAWGGATGQTYGYTPRRADILLDLSPMNRIVAVEPGDLTVTVEAGATLAQVQDALATHGQFLPIDVPDAETATMGGILATNAWGPSRLLFGTARDWLIGISVVDAQGRRVSGGGKVVKNVTGYDLPKMHIGALGTLGVIVEATFKTAPLPESSRGFLLGGANVEFAALLPRLHDQTTPTISLLRYTPGVNALALVYTGFTEVVEGEMSRALEIAHAHGADVITVPDTMPAPFAGRLPAAPLVLRVHGDRAESWARHVSLTQMHSWQMVDTLPGTGHTTLYLADDTSENAQLANTILPAMVQWCGQNRASLAVLHAPLGLRNNNAGVGEPSPLWFPLPGTLPLMRRLKQTLDPQETLNPGRFVGGL